MNYNSHELWALVFELRARVEALEAAQQPTIKESLTVAPAGSLVERIAWMIAKNVSEARPGTDCTPFASAAIREVAAWFDQIAAHDNDYVHRAAALLRYEAER